MLLVPTPSPRGVAETKPEATTIRFETGWRTVVDGTISAGREILLKYDASRLPDCRSTGRGAVVWDIEVHVKFHPGAVEVVESVLDRVRSPPEHGMVVDVVPRDVLVHVPPGTEHIEMWFHNWYQTSSRCDSWDSRFGENYWFSVHQIPQERNDHARDTAKTISVS
jgi:Family of unknown function (DUF6209)